MRYPLLVVAVLSAALGAIVVPRVSFAAPASGATGRYQLVQGTISIGSDTKVPSMFRIDTQTGTTWHHLVGPVGDRMTNEWVEVKN